MTREQMIEKLHAGTCRVFFYKLNGEQRDMECTLNMDIIPVDKHPKSNKQRTSDTIRAFDINKQEFRSFIPENVIEFEAV